MYVTTSYVSTHTKDYVLFLNTCGLETSQIVVGHGLLLYAEL